MAFKNKNICKIRILFFCAHITRNNCGFPKGFFEFSHATCPQEIKLVWNARIQVWPLTTRCAAFDFHRCRQRRYLANWIYMPRLLDPCQIGCTWFRSTYSKHYGILYDGNADPARAGARTSSTAWFYDVKFQRRAQMTDLRRRTVPDERNRRHKRTLCSKKTCRSTLKSLPRKTLGTRCLSKICAHVAVNASIATMILDI